MRFGMAFPFSESQQGLNQASAREFERADAELNRVYRQLSARLEPERRAKLKAAQQAWLKYRDANSEFVASEMAGGSAYPMLYNGSCRQMTEARTKELKQTLQDMGGR